MVLRSLLEGGRIAGSGLTAFGTMIIAQARAEDIERWIAGGVIALIGVFLVRWALKTSERVEATYVTALDSANERAERAREDAEHYRHLYEQERELRISLEKAGVVNRRRQIGDTNGEPT